MKRYNYFVETNVGKAEGQIEAKNEKDAEKKLRQQYEGQDAVIEDKEVKSKIIEIRLDFSGETA